MTAPVPLPELRAAINLGNRVLAARDAEGNPAGISVDLARAIARQCDRDVVFRTFERAVDVSNSAGQNVWDFCFLAVDPERARTIAFTPPYVRISGSYLVRQSTGAAVRDDVIAKGLHIAVVEGSAYALHLSRQPGADGLVTMPDINAALVAFDSGAVEGVAGIEQAMREVAARRPGSSVLQPPFMEIRQAIGVSTGEPALVATIRSALDEVARSGALAAILERHGVGAKSALLPSPPPGE